MEFFILITSCLDNVSTLYGELTFWSDSQVNFIQLAEISQENTVDPRFNDQQIGKLYGAESRFNNIRFNDIPGLTMEI